MRAFHEIASDYCDWIERSIERGNLAKWLPGILADLIHAAFCLAEDDSPDVGAGINVQMVLTDAVWKVDAVSAVK